MKKYVDKTKLQEYTTKLTAKFKTVFALKGETATDAQVAEAVTDWLDENVNPVGSAVVVDSSLSVSGAAGDAKKTGDEFTDVKNELSFDEYLINAGLYSIKVSDLESGVWNWSTKANNAARARIKNLLPVRAGMTINYTVSTYDVYFGVLAAKDSPDYSGGQAGAWKTSSGSLNITANGFLVFNIRNHVDTSATFDPATWDGTVDIITQDKDILLSSFKSGGVLANNTDLDNVKTEGHYILAATRTYANCPYPSPSSSTGMLEVLRYNDNIVFQRVTFAPTQKFYKRAALNGTFPSEWTPEFQTEGSLPSGTDLDDVKGEGHYLLYSGYSYENAPFDTPTNYFCTLEVLHTTNNTVLQRISNTKTGTIYYRQSLLGSFSDPWVEINGTVNQKYVFDDLDASKYLAFRTAMYVSESSLSGYSCKLIPVKKGTTAHIRTATRYPICPYGKVKYNYLLDYKAPFVNETDITYIDETVTFDYDGFIALNCMSSYHNYLLVELSYSTQAAAIKDNLFIDAPENPYNFIPEFDPDNPCKYLKRGPSLMGAIHHWGIIGASYDSGEFNFTRPGATMSQLSSLDYYEYSWGSVLKEMNGIKDMYHYSNGGQNSKQWIMLTGNIETDGTGRGFSYPDGVETISQSWNGGLSTVSGIGPGGGCWWKVKEDVAQGRGKQAYVIVLGSNDINNNNPHDSDWNELTTYDENLYYKAGTTADIGTYDLSTDTDTVPAGKTAGVVPGIVNSYAAYMGAILNRLIALQPDCVIFLATIRNNFAWNENSIAIWNQYNDVLRDMAEMPQFADNVYLIDYAEYGPNYMQKDMRDCNVGYHPNAIGYHEVAYYYGTLIDYAIRNNFERLKLSQFIGTGKTYDPVT